MIKKFLPWSITAICLLILLFSLRECGNVKDDAAVDQRNLKNQIAGLQKQVTSSGDTIYKMGQIIVKRNSELAKLAEENDAISKITAQVKVKEVIEIVGIPVPFDRPVFGHCDSSRATWLKLPALYMDTTDRWFKVYGSINGDGRNRIDLLRVFSEPTITLGDAKKPLYKRLFKAPEPIVTYTNKNPYMRVTDIKNVIIQDDRKNKGKFGVSLQAGYGILLPNGKTGMYLGVGGDYRIISF
jgi:hypothetical protein